MDYDKQLAIAKFHMEEFRNHRNRHHSHVVGETIFYYDQHTKNNREGKIVTVVGHYSMNYYVIEVETGPPLNESFLHLVSEFQVEDSEHA